MNLLLFHSSRTPGRVQRGYPRAGPRRRNTEFHTPIKGERHIPTKQKMEVSNADRVRRWGAAHPH